MCSKSRTDIGRNQLWSHTVQHTCDVSYSEDWNIVRPYVKVPRKEGERKEGRKGGGEGREGKGRERKKKREKEIRKKREKKGRKGGK